MAQMPKAINYQAVARNAQGQALTNQTIKVRLSIVSSASGNPTLYSETRSVTTNALGLFNVQIGSAGAIATTGNFSTINWVNNTSATKSLKVELDVNNSGVFTDMGSQSLVTVPYAFGADQAINALNIGGHYVDTNTPAKGDILKWDGSAWVPSALAKSYYVSQELVGTVVNQSLGFAFLGTPTEVTLTAGQVVTVVLSASLGCSTGSATSVGVAPAYQPIGSSSVTAFSGLQYGTIASISGKTFVTVTGMFTVVEAGATLKEGEIRAGTYKIGFGVRNTSQTPINNNNGLNGFIMVQ